jgi:hypothetical protein
VLIAAALAWRRPEGVYTPVPRWLAPVGAAVLLVGGVALFMGCAHVH